MEVTSKGLSFNLHRFLLASFGLHFIALLLWNFFVPLNLDFLNQKSSQMKSIELTELSPEWRTVGKKNGTKGAITPRKITPLSVLQPQKLLQPKSAATNWHDLAQAHQDENTRSARNHLKESVLRPPIKTLKDLAATDLNKLGKIARGDLGQMGSSGLGIQFEIPEGVDIDELNKSEMLLYSFRLRIEELYLSSLFRVYQDYVLKNPHILARLQALSGNATLTGKITYDSLGKKITLSLPRISSSEDLNGFFSEVLKGMEKLPNPPGILFKNSQQFGLSYTLFIQGQ